MTLSVQHQALTATVTQDALRQTEAILERAGLSVEGAFFALVVMPKDGAIFETVYSCIWPDGLGATVDAAIAEIIATKPVAAADARNAAQWARARAAGWKPSAPARPAAPEPIGTEPRKGMAEEFSFTVPPAAAPQPSAAWYWRLPWWAASALLGLFLLAGIGVAALIAAVVQEIP